jgi:AcrR family transcriptional regulator/DNA-binding MarR family transcriptional regulator
MASIDKTRVGTPRLRPGPNGLPRGQVTEIQRSRMLTAAVQAVAEVGYARMTVAQVIGRAKVSRKTFYDVFLDREDCFLAAFEQAVAQARALVVESYTLESGWREGVRAGLARLLMFMDAEPNLAKLCVVETLGAGPRVLDSRAKVLDELAQVIDRGRSVRTATHEPPDVTAEGVIGAVFAVLHTRLLESGQEPLSNLLAPLMSMIVLPYLGSRAASRELARPAPKPRKATRLPVRPRSRDPLEGLDMRLTYRTVRVLVGIGAHPGASNRKIAKDSGIADQGQISKLLTRLQRLDLVENRGDGQRKGASNAWHLTERGAEVERAARPR